MDMENIMAYCLAALVLLAFTFWDKIFGKDLPIVEKDGYLLIDMVLDNVEHSILKLCKQHEAVEVRYNSDLKKWCAWMEWEEITPLGEVPESYIEAIKANQNSEFKYIAIIRKLDASLNDCRVRLLLETENGKLPKVDFLI